MASKMLKLAWNPYKTNQYNQTWILEKVSRLLENDKILTRFSYTKVLSSLNLDIGLSNVPEKTYTKLSVFQKCQYCNIRKWNSHKSTVCNKIRPYLSQGILVMVDNFSSLSWWITFILFTNWHLSQAICHILNWTFRL